MKNVFTMQKRQIYDVKGLQLEANRENPNSCFNQVDFSKSDENVFLVRSDEWKRDIKRIISDYGYDRKIRKDAIVMIDAIYSFSNDFSAKKDEIVSLFKDCLEWHKKNLGEVFSAVIHFDETTPHMHVASVPIFRREDGRVSLSAKELFGYKNHLSSLQTSLYKTVFKDRGFEPPERQKTRKERKIHKEALEYRAEKAKKEYLEVENSMKDLQKTLDQIAGRTFSKDLSLTTLRSIVNELSSSLENLKQKEQNLSEEKAKYSVIIDGMEHSLEDSKNTYMEKALAIDDIRTKIEEEKKLEAEDYQQLHLLEERRKERKKKIKEISEELEDIDEVLENSRNYIDDVMYLRRDGCYEDVMRYNRSCAAVDYAEENKKVREAFDTIREDFEI